MTIQLQDKTITTRRNNIRSGKIFTHDHNHLTLTLAERNATPTLTQTTLRQQINSTHTCLSCKGCPSLKQYKSIVECPKCKSHTKELQVCQTCDEWNCPSCQLNKKQQKDTPINIFSKKTTLEILQHTIRKDHHIDYNHIEHKIGKVLYRASGKIPEPINPYKPVEIPVIYPSLASSPSAKIITQITSNGRNTGKHETQYQTRIKCNNLTLPLKTIKTKHHYELTYRKKQLTKKYLQQMFRSSHTILKGRYSLPIHIPHPLTDIITKNWNIDTQHYTYILETNPKIKHQIDNNPNNKKRQPPQIKQTSKSHTFQYFHTYNSNVQKIIQTKYKQCNHPSSQRHIIAINLTKNEVEMKHIYTNIKNIQPIIKFEINKAPFITAAYYRGRTLKDTPIRPKNNKKLCIFILENTTAKLNSPVPKTAPQEISEWLKLTFPSSKTTKATSPPPYKIYNVHPITENETMQLQHSTLYQAKQLNYFDLHNKKSLQHHLTPLYARRIGVIPHSLTPYIRSLGIRQRHVNQTLSSIHKTILTDIHTAWKTDQKTIRTWSSNLTRNKPRKLTKPNQVSPHKRKRKYNTNILTTRKNPPTKITSMFERIQSLPVNKYSAYHKKQKAPTPTDHYSQSTTISHKRSRLDLGATKWTIKGHNYKATKEDYKQYSLTHLLSIYNSISHTKPPLRKSKKRNKLTRRKQSTPQVSKQQSRQSLIKNILLIDNTFQALVTHHEWINRTENVSYKLTLPQEPVHMQKLGVSTANINEEFAFWQTPNRWKPNPHLRQSYPTSTTTQPPPSQQTWKIGDRIDIPGIEFQSNVPYYTGTISGKVKEDWEATFDDGDIYYYTDSQLTKQACPHNHTHAQHFDLGACEICTEPSSLSTHVSDTSIFKKAHKCKCGFTAHTSCITWTTTTQSDPQCSFCCPHIPTPHLNPITPKRSPITNPRAAYAGYYQNGSFHVHKIPQSSHRISYKPSRHTLASIRQFQHISTRTATLNPTTSLACRHTTTTLPNLNYNPPAQQQADPLKQPHTSNPTSQPPQPSKQSVILPLPNGKKKIIRQSRTSLSTRRKSKKKVHDNKENSTID